MTSAWGVDHGHVSKGVGTVLHAVPKPGGGFHVATPNAKAVATIPKAKPYQGGAKPPPAKPRVGADAHPRAHAAGLKFGEGVRGAAGGVRRAGGAIKAHPGAAGAGAAGVGVVGVGSYETGRKRRW